MDLLREVVHLLKPEKMALGGFSQGAMLSLDVALSSDFPLAGLVLLSGTHIAAKVWGEALASKGSTFPIFMSHGRDDSMLPFGAAERLQGILRESGIEVDWHPFRGGHGIPPEVVSALGAFLSRTLA
jgi:phospholipase/carboxylesterase